MHSNLFWSYQVRYLNVTAKIFLVLIFTSLPIDILSLIVSNKGNSNLYLLRINTIVEFSLLSLFFASIFSRKIIKQSIALIIILFSGIAGFDFYKNGTTGIDSLSTTIEAMLIMIYVLGVFYKLITRTTHVNILSVPLFWFSSGILLYFSGNFALFIFEEFVIGQDTSLSTSLWTIHSVIHILFHFIITFGFWKTKNI